MKFEFAHFMKKHGVDLDVAAAAQRIGTPDKKVIRIEFVFIRQNNTSEQKLDMMLSEAKSSLQWS